MISKNIFKSLLLFAAGAALIASCDSEYNDIGADIIEGDIHHNGMTRYEGSVVAYDRSTGAVQANNLPLNILGVYDNPAFGTTTAHFVTQLELASENPQISTLATVDSVYLHVPYFNTFQGKDETTGASTYELDSIYGAEADEMTLKIYRNNYFLRSVDPGSGTSEPQRYYSDDFPAVHTANITEPPLAVINNFKFSAAEVERKATVGTNATVKTVERFVPGIYTLLDKDYFQNILLAGDAENKLVNNNTFKEYFRGLYFNVTQNGTSGAMANVRFSEGKIVIIYHDYPLKADGSPDQSLPKTRKTITFNMKGNTINFFRNDYKPGFLAALTPEQTNITAGDSELYIKGGEGSMGIINILNIDEINYLKAENAIINEANLVFYVDKDKMGPAPKPLRVYLYDLKNRQPLYDYYTDATSSPLNAKYDKAVFGGILSKGKLRNEETNEEDEVFTYRVRLTNHINNLIRKDSTSVPLGLVVTENINIIANTTLRTPFTVGDTNVNTLPLSDIISPPGVVFYGNNIPVSDPNYNKRLRLEIFYTKPN